MGLTLTSALCAPSHSPAQLQRVVLYDLEEDEEEEKEEAEEGVAAAGGADGMESDSETPAGSM